jgi:hypothetical protein
MRNEGRPSDFLGESKMKGHVMDNQQLDDVLRASENEEGKK